MSELPMRGHFRYLRFKTFPMTPKTLRCEVFCPLLLSYKHSGVPKDFQPLIFPSVGLHPHTWPKWGCDNGGAKRTTTFLKKSYYWPNLKEDAKEYMNICLTCQQNRVLNKKQAGLFRPLPISERRWESVSMDFMVNLPLLRGFDAIMVVVDRFNKMAHFIPTKENAMAQETRRLFFTHVFKHHGLPKDIVSDRDLKFTNKF